MRKLKIKTILMAGCVVFAGCNSIRTLYTSAESKKDFWTVNAYTMSHCGCTQLFVENFRKGKHDFQIMYTDNIAQKNIFEYDEKGRIVDTVRLIAAADNFTIVFDSLDNAIYRQLENIVNSNELVYEMKWTDYGGYIKK